MDKPKYTIRVKDKDGDTYHKSDWYTLQGAWDEFKRVCERFSEPWIVELSSANGHVRNRRK